MPRGDSTGPNGQGPMTGRGVGFCAGNNRPGFMEPGIGFRGGGRFRAFGRGFKSRFFQPEVITETEEQEMLKNELKALKQEMKTVEDRIKELNKKNKD